MVKGCGKEPWGCGKGKQLIPLCSRCICRNQPTRPRPKVPAALHPTPPHARTYTRTHPHARTYTRKETRNEAHRPRPDPYAKRFTRTHARAPPRTHLRAYLGMRVSLRNNVSFLFVSQMLFGCMLVAKKLHWTCTRDATVGNFAPVLMPECCQLFTFSLSITSPIPTFIPPNP